MGGYAPTEITEIKDEAKEKARAGDRALWKCNSHFFEYLDEAREKESEWKPPDETDLTMDRLLTESNALVSIFTINRKKEEIHEAAARLQSVDLKKLAQGEREKYAMTLAKLFAGDGKDETAQRMLEKYGEAFYEEGNFPELSLYGFYVSSGDDARAEAYRQRVNEGFSAKLQAEVAPHFEKIRAEAIGRRNLAVEARNDNIVTGLAGELGVLIHARDIQNADELLAFIHAHIPDHTVNLERLKAKLETMKHPEKKKEPQKQKPRRQLSGQVRLKVKQAYDVISSSSVRDPAYRDAVSVLKKYYGRRKNRYILMGLLAHSLNSQEENATKKNAYIKKLKFLHGGDPEIKLLLARAEAMRALSMEHASKGKGSAVRVETLMQIKEAVVRISELLKQREEKLREKGEGPQYGEGPIISMVAELGYIFSPETGKFEKIGETPPQEIRIVSTHKTPKQMPERRTRRREGRPSRNVVFDDLGARRPVDLLAARLTGLSRPKKSEQKKK